MELKDFQVQLQRIKRCFGEKHYPPERADILWREVKDQTAAWMTTAVDHFVSTRPLHQPPLPADFLEIARTERERNYEKLKVQRAKDAEEFWSQAPAGFFEKFVKSIEPSKNTDED